MQPLNKTLIEGNLVSDVSLSENFAGYPCAAFTISTFRTYNKGGEPTREVHEFDVEAYGRAAEFCAEHLRKGGFVRITEGRLKQDKWTARDSLTGEEKAMSQVKIVATRVEF